MKTNYGKFVDMQLDRINRELAIEKNSLKSIKIGLLDLTYMNITSKDKQLDYHRKMVVAGAMEYLLLDIEFSTISRSMWTKLKEITKNDFDTCDELVSKVLSSDKHLMEALILALNKYDNIERLEDLQNKSFINTMEKIINLMTLNKKQKTTIQINALKWLDFIKVYCTENEVIRKYVTHKKTHVILKIVNILSESQFQDDLDKFLKSKRKNKTKLASLIYIIEKVMLSYNSTDDDHGIIKAKHYVNYQEKIRLRLEKGCK